MSQRILIACLLVLAGVGAIVAIATTAGPPDGYVAFHDRKVRAYLPADWRTIQRNQGPVIIDIAGPDRDTVELSAEPRRGRTLAQFETDTLDAIRSDAPDIQNLQREDTDVTGADEARKLTFHNQDLDVTLILARDGDRFVQLTINDVVDNGKDDSLDPKTVEDSFAVGG
jgi:hypothetical protein